MKDVLIKIRTAQDVGTEDEDLVEFSSDGVYTFDDDIAVATYMESEVTGLEGTRTSVIVLPEQIVVDREGLITSRMEFSAGSSSSFLYNTPYGTATLSINTRSISRRFDEHGGELKIDYIVDMEHSVVMRNVLHITVTEQKQIGEKPNA